MLAKDDVIHKHFTVDENVVDDVGYHNRCSDNEIRHYSSLLVDLPARDQKPPTLLNDPVKREALSIYYWRAIAQYLCKYDTADFLRYVYCSGLPLGADYFQGGELALEICCGN